MGKIINLGAEREKRARASRDDPQTAVITIITDSFDEYVDQMVRGSIARERLLDPAQRGGLAASLVRGWITWCGIEAGSERITERERTAFTVIAATRPSGRVYEEALVRALSRLAALAAEAGGPV